MIRGAFTLLLRIWTKPIARIITSLAILSLLLIKLPLADLWNTIRQISFVLWMFCVIAFVSGHLVGVVKWKLLINLKKNILPFLIAIRFYFAGLFANLCLPSIVGGDLIRAGMAIRFSNEKGSVILGSLLDRVIDTTALGIIIGVSASISSVTLSAADRKILLLFIIFLSVFALCSISIPFIPLSKRIPKRINEKIVRIQNILLHLIRNPQRAVTALGLALLIQSGFVLLNTMLGMACGIHIPLSGWFLVWPMAKFSAMIPISMGGLGVREVTLAVLLGRFGVDFTSSVGLGLLWQSILFAGGSIGGILYLILNKKVASKEYLDAASVLRDKE